MSSIPDVDEQIRNMPASQRSLLVYQLMNAMSMQERLLFKLVADSLVPKSGNSNLESLRSKANDPECFTGWSRMLTPSSDFEVMSQQLMNMIPCIESDNAKVMEDLLNFLSHVVQFLFRRPLTMTTSGYEHWKSVFAMIFVHPACSSKRKHTLLRWYENADLFMTPRSSDAYSRATRSHRMISTKSSPLGPTSTAAAATASFQQHTQHMHPPQQHPHPQQPYQQQQQQQQQSTQPPPPQPFHQHQQQQQQQQQPPSSLQQQRQASPVQQFSSGSQPTSPRGGVIGPPPGLKYVSPPSSITGLSQLNAEEASSSIASIGSIGMSNGMGSSGATSATSAIPTAASAIPTAASVAAGAGGAILRRDSAGTGVTLGPMGGIGSSPGASSSSSSSGGGVGGAPTQQQQQQQLQQQLQQQQQQQQQQQRPGQSAVGRADTSSFGPLPGFSSGQSFFSAPMPQPSASPKGMRGSKSMPELSDREEQEASFQSEEDYQCHPGEGDIPSWLRTLRLHKYNDVLQHYDFATLSQMSDDDLSKAGVTAQGARRKLQQAIRWNNTFLEQLQGLDREITQESSFPQCIDVLAEVLVTFHTQLAACGKLPDFTRSYASICFKGFCHLTIAESNSENIFNFLQFLTDVLSANCFPRREMLLFKEWREEVERLASKLNIDISDIDHSGDPEVLALGYSPRSRRRRGKKRSEDDTLAKTMRRSASITTISTQLLSTPLKPSSATEPSSPTSEYQRPQFLFGKGDQRM